MNTIYRIVWNATAGKWVVASELAKGRKKKAASALAPALLFAVAAGFLGMSHRVEASTTQYGNNTVVSCGVPANGALLNPLWTNGTNVCGTAVGEGAQGVLGGTALGDHAVTSGFYGVALGAYSSAATHATAVGPSAMATGSDSFAGGVNSTAGSSFAVAIGASSNASAASSTAIGQNAKALNASGATAIGRNANADSGTTPGVWSATSIGTNSAANGDGASALGDSAKATADRAVAVGRAAQATVANTTALGASAQATATNSVALGQSSVANRANTVSVGAVGSERQVVNVAAGAVTATSTDAVNGSQLFATNQNVTNVGNRVTKNEGDITNLDSRVTTVQGSVTNLTANISNGTIGLVQQAGAGAGLTVGKDTDGASVSFADRNGGSRTLIRVGAGAVTASSTDAINGSQLFATNQNVTTNTSNITNLQGAVTNVGNRVTKNEGDITNIQANLDDALKYADSTHASITLSGSAGTKITNVAAGDVSAASTDAVNGAQLFATNQNVTNIDNRVTKSEGDIANLDSRVTTNEGDITNLKNGTIGLVQQAGAGAVLTVGKDTDGTSVSFADKDGKTRTLAHVSAGTADTDAVNVKQLKDAGVIGDDGGLANVVTYDDMSKGAITLGGAAGTKITNVADGNVASDSKDAVNGSQLYATNQQVAQNTSSIDTVATNLTNATRYFKANGKNDGTDDAVATGDGAIAIGAGAQAKFANSVAIGSGATTDYPNAVAVGMGSTASQEGVAMGHNAKAMNTNTIAIGSGAQASAQQSTAVGAGAQAIDSATAMGQGARALGSNSTAFGAGAMVAPMVTGAVALGANSIATRANTVSVGVMGGERQIVNVKAGSQGTDAVNLDQLTAAIGDASTADTRYFKADGKNDGTDDALVTGSNSVAIGAGSMATRDNAADVGSRQITGVVAGTQDTDAVNVKQLKDTGLIDGSGNTLAAVTYDKNADGTPNYNSVTMGGSKSSGPVTIKNVAEGQDDTDAVNVAQLKKSGLIGNGGDVMDAVIYDAGSNRSVVTFGGAGGTVLANVAAGRVNATSMDAVNGSQLWDVQDQINQIGDRVTNIENNIGAPARPVDPVNPGNPGGDPNPHFASSGDTAKPAIATGSSGVATGENAQATGSNSSATGSNSVASGNNSVAMGAGSQATADNAVALGNNSVADRGNSVSVGSAGNERQITNVAAGTQRTDAANFGQVQDAVSGVQNWASDRFDGLSKKINDNQRQANRGIAASAALVNNMPYLPGKTTLNAGVAAYRGQSAVGAGMSRWSDSGRFNVNAGVSAARGDAPIFRVGVGVVLGD